MKFRLLAILAALPLAASALFATEPVIAEPVEATAVQQRGERGQRGERMRQLEGSERQLRREVMERTPGARASQTPAFEFPKVEDVRTVKPDEIDKMIAEHGKDLLVVNYWATWCGPCIEEMPYFQSAWETYRERGVQVVGLSTDFISEWENLVPSKLEELKITYSNLVVDIADADAFIEGISDEWTGALPATFYYNRNGEKVGERLGAIDKATLVADIERLLPERPARAGAMRPTLSNQGDSPASREAVPAASILPPPPVSIEP